MFGWIIKGTWISEINLPITAIRKKMKREHIPEPVCVDNMHILKAFLNIILSPQTLSSGPAFIAKGSWKSNHHSNSKTVIDGNIIWLPVDFCLFLSCNNLHLNSFSFFFSACSRKGRGLVRMHWRIFKEMITGWQSCLTAPQTALQHNCTLWFLPI